MNHKLTRMLSTSSIVVFVAMAPGLAAAAQSDGAMKGKMHKIDTNGDGKISRDEAAQYKGLAKHFDQIDTNKDGFLSKDELKASHAKRADARFRAIDRDGDGRISRAEADAKAPRLSKHFDQIDTNKDGYLSKDEIAAARKLAHDIH